MRGTGGNYNRELRPMLKSWVMNWLDIVLIGFVVIGALRGFRIGFIGAAVNLLAILVGLLVASVITNALGPIGGDSWTRAGVAVAVYVIAIAVIATILQQLVWRGIRKFLGLVTLGASSKIDRLGGLLLGIALGVALAGALIVALAIFTHEMPIRGIPSEVSGVTDVLERALAGSALVDIFIAATAYIPSNAFGFMPPAIAESLETLGSRF